MKYEDLEVPDWDLTASEAIDRFVQDWGEEGLRNIVLGLGGSADGVGAIPRFGSPNTGLTHKVEVEERTYVVTLRWRADEKKRRLVLEGVFIVRTDGGDLLGSDLRELGWRELVALDRRILKDMVDATLRMDREGLLSEYGLDLSGAEYVAEVMQDGRRKYPEDHYRLVGRIYNDESARGTRDVIQATARDLTDLHATEGIPWIPQKTKSFPKTTVRNWIATARKKGFIDDGPSS